MFNLTDKTLMKMLFERGLVTEIAGVMHDGHDERRWEVRRYTKNLFRDDEHYTVTVSGCYEDFTGETLDEALAAFEGWLAEEKEIWKAVLA